MFEEKWNIPRNVCAQSALTRDNMDLFVGREEQIQYLMNRVTGNSLTILEGILGAGKTSFGNYVRFSSKTQFSPTIELKSFPWWTNEDFILHVIAAIVEELTKGKTYKIKVDKEMDKIIQKYKSFFTQSYSGGINAGMPLVGSAGINFGKSTSFSRSSNNSFIEYESDLRSLASMIQVQMKTKQPIIIQVNNLDLGEGFSEEEMTKLLNSLRDIFLFPEFSWILTGKNGLQSFLSDNCKKISDISSFIEIDSFNIEDIKKIFEKRIEFEGYSGSVPMSYELIESIYKATRGSIRQSFKMIEEVLSYYVSTPLKEDINEADIKSFFTVQKKSKIKNLKEKSTQILLIKALQKNNGENQKFLKGLKEFENISQPYISQELTKLIESKLITKEKIKQNNYYFVNPEFFFCDFDLE